MNERFFELKKSRQDQIINGAMRIFAENGYRHASTDEMVAAAGISKGLLFHYFKSKKGTWLFLYEYSTRYSLLEMRQADRLQDGGFFEMYRQLVMADAAVLRKYPWIPLFLKRADTEFDQVKVVPEDLSEELRCAVSSHRAELLAGAARPMFLSAEDAEKIRQMLEYTRFGLMRELLGPGQVTSANGPDNDPSGSLSGLDPSPKTPDSIPGQGYDIFLKKMTDYLWTLRRMNV